MKTGLVLSGGGAKGAWQVGALSYIADSKHSTWANGFNFVSGTSVGAINGAGIAMFPAKRFSSATKNLKHLWLNFETKDVYKHRFPKYLAGLWHDSLSKTDPLEQMLRKNIRIDAIHDSRIELRIPAVDLLTEKLVVFDQTHPELIKAIMASASFPGEFPPVELDGMYLTDGGVKDIAPLGAAIESGCTNIMVLGCTNPYDSEILNPSDFKNVLSLAKRVIEIMSVEILLNDLSAVRNVNKRIRNGSAKKKKLINIQSIFPSKTLGDPLDFSLELTMKRMAQGYEDARLCLS